MIDLRCGLCKKRLTEHPETRGGRFYCDADHASQQSPAQFQPATLDRFADETETKLWGQLVANAVRGGSADPVATADYVILELRKRIGGN